jgi:hypothetical protein
MACQSNASESTSPGVQVECAKRFRQEEKVKAEKSEEGGKAERAGKE